VRASPRLLVFFASITIVTKAFGYTPPRSDTVYSDRMPPVLHYVGFSLPRPTVRRWYLSKSEQIPTEAAVRRESPGASTVPQVHVRIGELPHIPRSPADFAVMVRQDHIAAAMNREVLSYLHRPAVIRGQMAMRFELRIRDLRRFAVGPRPVIRASGYVVQHPSRRRVAVAAVFWDSTLSGVYDRRVAREARAILENVSLDAIQEDQLSELGPL
jgi:hypothetical protein